MLSPSTAGLFIVRIQIALQLAVHRNHSNAIPMLPLLIFMADYCTKDQFILGYSLVNDLSISFYFSWHQHAKNWVLIIGVPFIYGVQHQ